MKCKPDSITRSAILKEIEAELDGVYQWGKQIEEKCINTGYTGNAFVSMHRAEVLIELLEVHDCGSIGGFDGGENGLYSLEKRFKLLKKKKGTE